MTAPTRLLVDDRPAIDEGTGVALPVVTTAIPRFSWVVPLERNGQRQVAWQIRASALGDPRERGELWDSGVVHGDQNSDVAWGGAPLPAFLHALWSVRTTDEAGVESDWADPAPLLSGPLTSDDWTAAWIEVPATHAARTVFRLPDAATVMRATLHFAAAGVLRAVVDGSPVNPDALDPTDSSLRRAVSRSYDVTGIIRSTSGEHSLALAAGLGHYGQVLARPRLLAELHIALSDGSTRVIATSAQWTHSPSPVVFDAPFYLEEHDARVAASWATAASTPVDEPVAVVARDAEPALPETVTPDAGPPVRVVRVVDATQVGAPAEGVRVFDLGENVAGRARVELRGGRPGRRIVIAHGEKLGATGRVDSTNIRLPSDRDRERQLLAWTTAGSLEAPEVASAWFAVHGFRYIEVRGLRDEEVSVSAGVLHSAVERSGWFSSDEPLLDRLVERALRTQLNNIHGLPEDCPTREQAGWTGDAAASAEAALSHLDLSNLYANWLVDVALEARDGGVLGISPRLQPEAAAQPVDPVWGAALTEIPWQQWWATGDLGPVRRLLPAMRRWADWQLGTLEDGVVRHAEISFGADWLAREQTPPVMLQTAAVIRSLRALADLENAAGDGDQAALRDRQADAIVRSARRMLHDTDDAVWANDSQASIALALTAGLAEPHEVPRLRRRLAEKIARSGDRVSSGFAGTGAVVRALGEADGGTALLAAIRQPAQPGIGSMLVDGPGTFWETWWIDDENVGVASLDHIGLAAPFAAWAWQYVAGVRVIEPGFRRFAVAPRLTRQVGSVSVRRMTRRGMIEVDWMMDGLEFRCELTVPVGSIAELACPNGETAVLEAGRHSIVSVGLPPAHAAEPEDRRTEHTGRIWLSDGHSSTWRPGDAGIRVVVEGHDVVCTPVFHETIPAPTLAVSIDDFAPGTERWIVLEQDGPLDLSAAAFVFAGVDVDGPDLPGRIVRPLLRLSSSDGTSVVGDIRPLPIAWNRVAVDVEDWAGRSSVTRVELGIRWSDDHDLARGPYLPLPAGPARLRFRVGRAGWTSAKRTY